MSNKRQFSTEEALSIGTQLKKDACAKLGELVKE